MKRYLYIGILGCLVAVGAIVLTYWQTEDDVPESKLAVEGSAEDSRVSRDARGTGIPVPVPPPVAAFGTDRAHPEKAPVTEEPGTNGKSGNAGTAQPRQEQSDSTAGVPMPVFDVVRVNPEGDALIAGRAPIGAEVGIYDGDKRTGTAIADNRGEWVYLPGNPLPPGQREISLSLIGKDGTETRSESVVVLMVPDQNLAKAPVSASVPQDGAEKKSEGVLAVLVAREGNAPSRILQKPSEAQGLGDKALSIDVIDYDDKGNVSIGGKATPGTSVQIYVDNEPAAQGVLVSPDGNWQVIPEGNIGVGVHTLRVDGLSDNKVVARVEMPFSRAEPHTTADVAKGIVVVQPGNSLWRIARRTLGAGVRYTEIYDANRSKIVDPDLIYPGQLFSLPDPN